MWGKEADLRWGLWIIKAELFLIPTRELIFWSWKGPQAVQLSTSPHTHAHTCTHMSIYCFTLLPSSWGSVVGFLCPMSALTFQHSVDLSEHTPATPVRHFRISSGKWVVCFRFKPCLECGCQDLAMARADCPHWGVSHSNCESQTATHFILRTREVVGCKRWRELHQLF